MAGGELGEMRAILQEATRVFSDGEDAAMLKKCVQEEVELKKTWSKEAADARSLIKALSGEYEEVSASIVKLESAEAHETVLQTLDKDKLELAKRANGAETAAAEKKAEIRKLEAEIAAMQADIESGNHEVAVSNPKIDHAFSLYGMVSNIQWLHADEGTAANANRVQGTASNKELGQLRNFALDTTRHSEQWVTDHLWSMVSPVA